MWYHINHIWRTWVSWNSGSGNPPKKRMDLKPGALDIFTVLQDLTKICTIFWMQRLNHRIHADEVASIWSYLIYIGKIIISCPKKYVIRLYKDARHLIYRSLSLYRAWRRAVSETPSTTDSYGIRRKSPTELSVKYDCTRAMQIICHLIYLSTSHQVKQLPPKKHLHFQRVSPWAK